MIKDKYGNDTNVATIKKHNMLKIRYQTPSGAVSTTEIPAPEHHLEKWQMKGYIRRELQIRNIEFKNQPQII